ncbi:MAG TPA: hypothetical protein VFX96_14875 [Pyrinomonadaceae bacterium]|nr:hypothetical protein [Pyrinomonadaceae bacterium]
MKRDAPSARDARRPTVKFYLLLFAAAYLLLFVTHLPLLNLPYYWDEAGYFIPAARDIYAEGEFVPVSTLSNAHPPLVMAYLALAWKAFGFHIEVARAAMLGVAALALVGLFRLAERAAGRGVAWATIICTAAYPVFFAQSSLAHLDMAAAAFTIWALDFYLPRGDLREHGAVVDDGRADARRRVASVALFAGAAMAKETALLAPFALFGWEVACGAASRFKLRVAERPCLSPRRPAWHTALLLLAAAPLLAWLAYHRSRTGYFFGNPDYFRYNVEATLGLARIAEAARGRAWQLTAHMNLWALTLPAALLMLGAMLKLSLARPVEDGSVERRRIDVRVQLVFAVLVLAYGSALSIVGGAVLARYMLPVVPLVILVSVSTIHRRVRRWRLVVALACVVLAAGIVVNPPHSFPWEDNLAYRDFVLLHRDAARFIEATYEDPRVLTAWPATDELRNPFYGYAARPARVVALENFREEHLRRASASDYDVALLFSTHGGPTLEEAVARLGARAVRFRAERRGQWVAVVEK